MSPSRRAAAPSFLLLLVGWTACLSGCAGAPLREQLPPGYDDLAPPALAEVCYERYGGRTPLSAVLAPVASRSFSFGWQALAAEGRREGDEVRVEVVFVGPPLSSGDPPLEQVLIGLYALEPPDLAHEGRVDLLPALEVPPLLRQAPAPGPDGVTYQVAFSVPAAQLRWNAKDQAALLASVLYRTADGLFVRENRDFAVGEPPEPPPGEPGEPPGGEGAHPGAPGE